MTEQEQKAFDQMREALETCTYTSSYDKSFDIVKVEEALTAANAVQPEPPSDENISDAWISASDSDGIAYDGPSFERGYRLGRGEYDEYTGALVAAARAEQPQAQGEALTDELIDDLRSRYTDKRESREDIRNLVRAAVAAAHPQATEPAWRPIESAPKDGTLVVVYSPNGPDDWPDSFKVYFDYFCKDYENWFYHSEAHENYMAVGGSNACGPDAICTGPSREAPYTHWMPLPAAPEAHHE